MKIKFLEGNLIHCLKFCAFLRLSHYGKEDIITSGGKGRITILRRFVGEQLMDATQAWEVDESAWYSHHSDSSVYPCTSGVKFERRKAEVEKIQHLSVDHSAGLCAAPTISILSLPPWRYTLVILDTQSCFRRCWSKIANLRAFPDIGYTWQSYKKLTPSPMTRVKWSSRFPPLHPRWFQRATNSWRRHCLSRVVTSVIQSRGTLLWWDWVFYIGLLIFPQAMQEINRFSLVTGVSRMSDPSFSKAARSYGWLATYACLSFTVVHTSADRSFPRAVSNLGTLGIKVTWG